MTIIKVELHNAINKFESNKSENINMEMLQSILFQKKEYKYKFIVKIGQANQILEVNDIAYFYTEDGYSIAVDYNKKKHIIDNTLDQIQNDLDPNTFFRINRGALIRDKAIIKFEPYFNSRISIQTQPAHHEILVVARENAKDFKNWIEK